jgi:hypothetical protein
MVKKKEIRKKSCQKLPNPKSASRDSDGAGLFFVWTLPGSLSGIGDLAGSETSRRHSLPDHGATQTPSPR